MRLILLVLHVDSGNFKQSENKTRLGWFESIRISKILNQNLSRDFEISPRSSKCVGLIFGNNRALSIHKTEEFWLEMDILRPHFFYVLDYVARRSEKLRFQKEKKNKKDLEIQW